ncbi:MAG: hypothetical protein HY825_13495 [Acidobacteria bacterium]|nr:hypothetical protein [Acidobacteriota bacterium]
MAQRVSDERIEAELPRAEQLKTDLRACYYHPALLDLRDARARIAELESALRPFAAPGSVTGRDLDEAERVLGEGT